jgi:hypothetical protein
MAATGVVAHGDIAMPGFLAGIAVDLFPSRTVALILVVWLGLELLGVPISGWAIDWVAQFLPDLPYQSLSDYLGGLV